MNQENKNVKFNPNLPTAVELAFDEPKTGDGQYGTWYLYGIKKNINGENAFFATQILHEILQGMGVKAGTKLIITKIVKDDKTTWDVKAPELEKPVQEVSIDDVPEVIEQIDIKNESNLSLEEINEAFSKLDRRKK